VSDPTVEAALTDVVEQIAAGAQPLLLRGRTAAPLRERYRPDFEREIREDPLGWPRDKAKILVLARAVGLLAAFLTRADALLHGRPEPAELDDDCAYLAGFLMSRTLCPPPGGPEFLGKWCRSYPIAGGVYGDLLAHSIRPVLRFVLPPITTGPLAR
jgi:hypothetical protein